MNCHYCEFPIADGLPYVPIARAYDDEVIAALAEEMAPPRYADLACAILNNRVVPAIPDKTGKWCSYNHPPTGKWCMLAPHGDDVKHELEPKQ